jgi:hypothetical protein
VRQLRERKQEIKGTIHVDSNQQFTTVVIEGGRFTGYGTAKRHPDDAFVLQTGVDIATARAFRDLADQLERSAGRNGAHKRWVR